MMAANAAIAKTRAHGIGASQDNSSDSFMPEIIPIMAKRKQKTAMQKKTTDKFLRKSAIAFFELFGFADGYLLDSYSFFFVPKESGKIVDDGVWGGRADVGKSRD